MLQVIRHTILGVCAVIAAAFAGERLQWVLDDALQDEYVPLFQPDIIGPEDLKKAFEKYHKGDFRAALYYYEKVQALGLPDGDLDHVTFIAAECYRVAGLRNQALENYLNVCRRFPSSDKVAPSLFRIMTDAYERRDFETVDSLFGVFSQGHRAHPIAPSVVYLTGKSSFRAGRYAEASALLDKIPSNSVRYVQAQFLSALCRCELKEWERALLQLEYVRTQGRDAGLRLEAGITIGDVYAARGNYETALKFYTAVRRNSSRYQYSLVKRAVVLLAMGSHKEASRQASAFLRRYPRSEYYFEMASVLEQAYEKTGDRLNRARVSGKVVDELLRFRLAYEIGEELDRVSAVAREWQAVSPPVNGGGEVVDSVMVHIRALERKYNRLLSELGVRLGAERAFAASMVSERRYLTILRDSVELLNDSVREAERRYESLARGDDSDGTAGIAGERLDSLKQLRASCENEYALVIEECFGDRLDEERRAEEDRQAQFIDWTFRKYQQKKQELIQAHRRVARAADEPGDSALDSTAVTDAFAGVAKDRLEKTVEDDRRRMLSLIQSVTDMNPGGTYNPQLLMRLAELHFDVASDAFEKKLQDYETRMAQGESQQQLQFPEVDLSRSIDVYAAVARDFPRSEFADVAVFYHALALQKENKDSLANSVLLRLISRYPESPYFVEANMSIGRYYFEHPTVENGKGYTFAEEAFRRVLYYRDHPQFVQALYHLGWCYYMQDQYDEAIAVFRYLVEEVDLDFSKARMEDAQVANPLLREEAIDYIAVAFDERGAFEETVRFLRLIGSFDYSSVVLKRIGELREEVEDYDAALTTYRFLESEYPVSIAAPAASLNVIKILETRKDFDAALTERERFFERFGSGSEWQKAYLANDPSTVASVDSTALGVGLYVADAWFRKANDAGDKALFQKTARAYRAIVQAYGSNPRAVDALWNFAVILETKLGEDAAAYEQYTAYSSIEIAERGRREQAALNAVAIAQRLMPPDSSVSPGTVELVSGKLMSAVGNYVRLFPDGSARATVMLAQASVFFNRRMFGNAARLYEEIMALGGANREYYEAAMMLAQCKFQQEDWAAASPLFLKVYQSVTEQQVRSEAIKLHLQCRYQLARKLAASQQFAPAAQAYISIEQEYPGSEYGDIVLFNAAEMYEKMNKWTDAAKTYTELVRKFPRSKYAPDALFNAATAFEKADDFRKAADVYEQLALDYPAAEKARDGLFNLGLCYEKLGKTEKVAEVQERFSRLYPGEKDVEVMLIRSGEYYLKSGLYEKALAIFRSFTVRFPRTDRVVEATFKIGRAYEELRDEPNARLQYNAAITLDRQMVSEGMAGNSYYASEAAYSLARMQEKRFQEVKLVLPAKVLKQQQQKKGELLNEVVGAYQKVIEYQSERMFEAAYRIGALYDQLCESWINQQREKLDPVKLAVFEQELYSLASTLLQKSFVPYRKTLEIAVGFDSLGIEQKHWVGEARNALLKNYVKAGEYLAQAVLTVLNAPVPKQIEQKPVYLAQYLRQLHETLEPAKNRVRDYYKVVCDEIAGLKITDPAADTCRERFARWNYAVGGEYAELAQRILISSGNLPKNMDEIEKEEAVFQLEDIIFELQDKALFALEEAREIAIRESLTSGEWFQRIVQTLARLSPEKYGRDFFVQNVFITDDSWSVRGDSVPGWNEAGTSLSGWQTPRLSRRVLDRFTIARPRMVARDDASAATSFFRKELFVSGQPRGAAVYVAASGTYQLYVNGTLTLSDSIGARDIDQIDSATGITSLIRGGDNVLALRVESRDSGVGAAAVVLSVLIDTTKRFESKLPAEKRKAVETGDSRKSAAVGTAERTSADVSKAISDISGAGSQTDGADITGKKAKTPDASSTHLQPAASPTNTGRKRSALAVNVAVSRRERTISKVVEKCDTEQLKIQKLRTELFGIDAQIKRTKEETDRLRAPASSEP